MRTTVPSAMSSNAHTCAHTCIYVIHTVGETFNQAWCATEDPRHTTISPSLDNLRLVAPTCMLRIVSFSTLPFLYQKNFLDRRSSSSATNHGSTLLHDHNSQSLGKRLLNDPCRFLFRFFAKVSPRDGTTYVNGRHVRASLSGNYFPESFAKGLIKMGWVKRTRINLRVQVKIYGIMRINASIIHSLIQRNVGVSVFPKVCHFHYVILYISFVHLPPFQSTYPLYATFPRLDKRILRAPSLSLSLEHVNIVIVHSLRLLSS